MAIELSFYESDKEIGKAKLNGNHYDSYEEFDVKGGQAVLATEQCHEGDDDFLMAICQIVSGKSLSLIAVSYKEKKEFEQIKELLLLTVCQG